MRQSCKYTVYDSKKQDFCLVRAHDWKSAWLKALRVHGFVARGVNDVRPRTGTCGTPGSKAEVEGLVAKHI